MILSKAVSWAAIFQHSNAFTVNKKNGDFKFLSVRNSKFKGIFQRKIYHNVFHLKKNSNRSKWIHNSIQLTVYCVLFVESWDFSIENVDFTIHIEFLSVKLINWNSFIHSLWIKLCNLSYQSIKLVSTEIKNLCRSTTSLLKYDKISSIFKVNDCLCLSHSMNESKWTTQSIF